MLEGIKTKPKKDRIRVEIRVDSEIDRKLRLLAVQYNTSKAEIVKYAVFKLLRELENQEEAK